MPEEGFIQLYVRDFTGLAAKAEAGQDVEAALRKRVEDTRAHAQIMDARKAPGHLAAVAERLKTESARAGGHHLRPGPDPAATAARRKAFLLRVAEMLDADPEPAEPAALARMR